MTARALHLAKHLSLPADAVTQTFAIFGKRGSGKTNGATVLVEELLKAHLPVVILDPVDAWWGLKAISSRRRSRTSRGSRATIRNA